MFLLCEVFVLSGVQKANGSDAVQSVSRKLQLLKFLHHRTYIPPDAVKPRSSVKGGNAPYSFELFQGGNSDFSSAPVQREHARIATSAVQSAPIREQVKLVPSFQVHHTSRVTTPAAVQFGSVQSESISNLLPSGFNLPPRGSAVSIGHAGVPYGYGSAQQETGPSHAASKIPPLQITQAPSVYRPPTNPFVSGQSVSSSASSGYSAVNFAERFFALTSGGSTQRNPGLAQGGSTHYSSRSHVVNPTTGSAPGGLFRKPVRIGLFGAAIRYIHSAQSRRVHLGSTQRPSSANVATHYSSSANGQALNKPRPASAFVGSTQSRSDSGLSAGNPATTYEDLARYGSSDSVVRPSKDYDDVTPGRSVSRYYGIVSIPSHATFSGPGTNRVPDTADPIRRGGGSSRQESVKGGSAPMRRRPESSPYDYSNHAGFTPDASSSRRSGTGFAHWRRVSHRSRFRSDLKPTASIYPFRSGRAK